MEAVKKVILRTNTNLNYDETQVQFVQFYKEMNREGLLNKIWADWF